MCFNPKLFSEELCECVAEPVRIETTKSKVCKRSLGKLLDLLIETRRHVTKKRGRDDTEASEIEVEYQSYGTHLVRLCLRVIGAQDALGRISRMERTALSPICVLQMILLHHVDNSAEGTDHFINIVEKTLGLSKVTRLAKEALKWLTAFYDSYRKQVVLTTSAFVHHRYGPSSAPSQPTSEQRIGDTSFRMFYACRDCGSARSVHDKVSGGIDDDTDSVNAADVTDALSIARRLVGGAGHDFWIEDSKMELSTPTGGRSQAAVPSSSDYPLSGKEGTEDVKERLTGIAAKVTVVNRWADDDEPRSMTSYHLKGEDGSVGLNMSPAQLEGFLDGFSDRSELLTAFVASLDHTRSHMGTAFQSLENSDQLSSDQLSTKSAFIKELDGISDVISNIRHRSRSDGTSTD
jgi:hypothetical protein